MHNNALWSNSNAFSLIICKVYTKRENVGSWNSGPETAMSETPILHISKWAEILWGIDLEYIINIGETNHQRWAPRWPPLVFFPIFFIYSKIILRKISSHLEMCRIGISDVDFSVPILVDDILPLCVNLAYYERKGIRITP